MKQLDRTKRCSNCEADVSYEVTYCPFCGTDLLNGSTNGSQSGSEDPTFTDQTIQESLASLYKPPYSARNRQGLGVPDEREESTFKEAQPLKEPPLFRSYEESSVSEGTHTEEPEVVITRRGHILPLLLMMIGAHFFVLGLLILFCSKDGVVSLQWSSRFWFIYCLLGLPILYFGTRLLKSLQES